MKNVWGVIGLCLLSMSANAALLSRAGGQAYYDDVLNITWLADANYAYTSGYDTSVYGMTWSEAQTWIATLNTANHLGTNTWRLPTIIDTGTSGCNYAYTGTDCGYNVDLSTGEMAHLFYSTLSNTARFNTSGSQTGCVANPPNYCLTNPGPFSNMQWDYWSGTTYEPDQAWTFSFAMGDQSVAEKGEDHHGSWAVSSGDMLATVPVPGAVWLFCSAIGLMGWMRRKISS